MLHTRAAVSMIHVHANDGSLWTDALGYRERDIVHLGELLRFLSFKVLGRGAMH